MEKKVRYSVVIPLYNKEHYIKNTLQSVLKQTYKDYEIIVVDDGSADRSAEIVKEMNEPEVRLIQQPNQGVAVARNTGIMAAKGEFISFLDADDCWKPEYLATIHRLTKKYPESDIFVTAYQIQMQGGKMNYSTRKNPKHGCLDSYWLTLAGGYDFVWTSATTIRRSALIDAGCFKPGEKIGQDLDMWARVARHNPKVAYSARICVTYNRMAEQNARTRVKIAWAGAFIQDLEEEMQNPSHTKEELQAIQHKYDMKMTVYIFTAIMAGDKRRAGEALKNWKGKKTGKNCFLKTGLFVASLLPGRVCQWVYGIRLKVF